MTTNLTDTERVLDRHCLCLTRPHLLLNQLDDILLRGLDARAWLQWGSTLSEETELHQQRGISHLTRAVFEGGDVIPGWHGHAAIESDWRYWGVRQHKSV